MRPSLPLLLALVTTPALAFAPRGEVERDAEPARLVHADPIVQAEVLQDPAWLRFFKLEGAAWRARIDPGTRAPLRLWGAGRAVDTASAATVARDVRAVLDQHADALRVPLKALGAPEVNYSGDLDTWYLTWPVVYGGVPVYRGGVTARVKAGRLALLGVEAYADAPRLGSAALDAPTARDLAIGDGPAPDAWHEPLDAAQVWLPWEDDAGVTLRLVWQITTATEAPLARWVHFVDASTGELLHVHDELRWVDGTVEGLRNPRRPGEELALEPLTRLAVRNEAGVEALTDEAGRFSLAGTTYTAFLRGPDVVIVDAGRGNTASVQVRDGVGRFDTTVATQGEIDNFAAVGEVRAWAQQTAPEVTVGDLRGGVLRSNVNRRDGSCNAFYDGASINFFRAGNGCVNTAQLADVTWHEWGHGFHANSLEAGVFDGAISEGAADTVAFLISNDNLIGRGFFGAPDRGIRNVDNDRTYPRDVVGQVHTDGLILGGSMWELIEALEPRYGRDEARVVVGRLLAGALKGGPTLATVGPELLLADDDDGDLSNGSPHFCELTDVLGRRGLLAESGPIRAFDHVQRVDAPADVPFTVEASVERQLAACVDTTGLQAVYRVDGGAWERADATETADGVAMTLPALPFGSFVEYYLESATVSIPTRGFTSPFSLYVGGVLPLGCEDFEASDGGWTSTLLAGTDSEGANDWQWDWPRGRGGDAYRAASGRNVWGTDLGMRIDGKRYDGLYQGDKHTRLTSPELTFPEHYEGVFVRYARWLNVQDGSADQANLLADDRVVWSNHTSGTAEANEHHGDERWVQHSVDLGDTTADGRVALAFELITDGSRAFGGWNLDDVCLVAPATPNNRLAIIDLAVSPDTVGGITLTWTQPRWAPVREVVVVRTEGAPPTGPDDGVQVYSTTDPQLEALASLTDPDTERGRTYWYAAYASDGEDWLGWTVEGRNLVSAEGVGGGAAPIAGCGCATSPSPWAWGFAPVLLLALSRRRR